MNTSWKFTDNDIAAVPSAPLTQAEKELVAQRGLARFGASEPPVYMCGHCRAAVIDAESVGLCSNCTRIFEIREFEEARLNDLHTMFVRILIFGTIVVAIGLMLAAVGKQN